MIKKLIISLFIFVFFFSVTVNSYATYIFDRDAISSSTNDVVKVSAPVFNFQSKASLLMESSTGKILYANNEHEKLLPASVTKVMTMLLIMEEIDSGRLKFDDKITCSALASKMGGSQIWFKEGEQLTVNDALKALAVVSANDCAVAFAEHIAGSVDNFVAKMNEKAKSLEMNDTNFKNPHGIDEEGHYTSAHDIAIMSRELITKHPKILEFTSIWMDSLRDGTFGLTNTNKLIRFYEGANGIKTGSTSQALFNLSASATKNNMTLIAVAMKAPSSDIRNEEIKQMLDYGFSNFKIDKISETGKLVTNIKVNKGNIEEIEAVIENGFSYLKEKSDNSKVEESVIMNEKICAPLKKGDVVGKILYKVDGKEVGTSNVIASKDVEKATLFENIQKMIKMQFMM